VSGDPAWTYRDVEPALQAWLQVDDTSVGKRSIFVDSKRSPQPIPTTDFSLLLSTTDEYCLLQPPALATGPATYT
jgi:hypothetical protein